MNMDTVRGIIYGLTWPRVICSDIPLKAKDGRSWTLHRPGEDGKGTEYRVICRSIALNHEMEPYIY
jgi:hypothetical protein